MSACFRRASSFCVQRSTSIVCAYGTTLRAPVIITTLVGARRPGSRPGPGRGSSHDLRTHPGSFMQDSGHQTSGRERPRPQGAEECRTGVAHALTHTFSLLLCAARPAQGAGLPTRAPRNCWSFGRLLRHEAGSARPWRRHRGGRGRREQGAADANRCRLPVRLPLFGPAALLDVVGQGGERRSAGVPRSSSTRWR